jgi:hypothetical protein
MRFFPKFLFVLLTLAATYYGGQARGDPRVVLVEENDAFSLLTGRDFGYTQGFRGSLVFDDLSGEPMANKAYDLAGGLVFTYGAPQGPVRPQFEWIVLGQSMFTPFDKQAVIPDPADRPYAAWLYAGGTLAVESAGRQLDSFELLTGVVGPDALGKQVQLGFHGAQGVVHRIRGWDSQLKNEPALLVAWDRRWKFNYDLIDHWGFDVIPSLGLTAGNVYTYVSAGSFVRFGNSLFTTWGPTRIKPAPSGASFFNPGPRSAALGFDVFVGVEGRAMARNIFLDGNTFVNDGPSVQKNVFVNDFIGGLEFFTQSGARLAFSLTQRTQEFKSQPVAPNQLGRGDLFGSFEGSLRF